MSEPRPFAPVKYVCGILSSEPRFFETAAADLAGLFGPVERRSPRYDFDGTDYYAAEMGGGPLRREFLSFRDLDAPDRLAEFKLATNGLEDELRRAAGVPFRAVNLDPGYLTASALVMATAKNFAHRVPLARGIYAHLELLFGREGIRTLDWTYPDMRRAECRDFFLAVRGDLLAAARRAPG
jgi:hypothetical protein